MDEELTPQQAERVRRLLVEARHTDPVPDDVVTRLDRVLAELAADPGSRPGPADGSAADPARVVPLHERRRRAGRLLLAAAAVVVGGVAVAPLVSGGSDEMAGSTSEDADQGLEAPDRTEGQREAETTDGSALLPGAVSDTRTSVSKLPAQRVRADRFVSDARQLRRSATATRGDATSMPELELPDGKSSASRGGCSPGVWGGGRYLRVLVGREAGWLVFRPPRGATQVVDLFLCGEDSAERSATLPYR